jgi:hypothetical protein
LESLYFRLFKCFVFSVIGFFSLLDGRENKKINIFLGG